ncbi:M48 family metalloprotease [Hasllibacter sp. MH4015]|uniref:M48 family metalloprotease n=1 Tax=Hasllibacter sp. MH4015 TaxID=2854029 RepID=UPI001CD21192|nr:M48 family metalloprotease [Hasllibacter sp. MH4015]
MRIPLALITAFSLGACVAPQPTAAPAPDNAAPTAVPVSVARAIEVTRRIEPVAEAVCRAETPQQNCDFNIFVNRDPRLGVNAFQTIDPESGRPVIILTVGLIRAVRNDDELAFVIGHEAAHHIAQHIAAQQAAAQAGAQIFGANAQQQGFSRAQVIEAANLGALVGARRFGQAAELEADALGTLIGCAAGYDAIVGARFFTQLPDPEADILSTHPPNARRVEIVRRAAAEFC